MSAAVELRGLTRRFGSRVAVDDLTLTVEQGEILALLDQNGAGKTTTLRMLSCLLRPTAGDARLCGHSVTGAPAQVKAVINVSPQETAVAPRLSVRENLELMARLYGADRRAARSRAAAQMERFALTDRAGDRAGKLSGGLQRRLSIAMALISQPRVLFLDEPSIGLDAIASNQIRKFLKQVNQEKGTSIILTSHYMEDISTLCQRSVVIHHGCKVYDGKTEELFAKYQKSKKITACFSKELPGEISLPMAQILERTPHKLVFMVPREESGAALAAVMPWNPADISVEEDEIGTVVERIYQEGSRYEN